MDDPDTVDKGTAGATGLPIVDIGAYEWHWPEDIVVDAMVDFPDFSALAGQWPQTGCGWCNGCDVNRDGDISFLDVADLCKKWLQDY